MNLFDSIKEKGKRLPQSFFTIFGLFLGWFLLVSPTLAATTPAIVDISVGAKGNYVTMDAFLTEGITPKLQEAIESGVPLTFTFHVELKKQVPMWADELIRANTIHHTVQFDSLNKTYRFSEVGKNVKRKIITRKKSRSKKLMETLKNIPIAPVYWLKPNEKYYVRVKADLKMDKFWFPFNNLSFFVPFNDFKTSWTETPPLVFDPDPTETAETNTVKREKGGDPKSLDHVLRSFNK